MKYILILLSFFFLSCQSQVITITYVRDGDTVVSADGEVIRLYDIDAPELHQQFGWEAREFTEQTLLHQTVYIQRVGEDKYGRTLGILRFKPQASSINRMLVGRGMAWTSGIYCHDPDLIEDMQFAKEVKFGLWAYPNPTPPYIFRRQNKHK